MAALDTQAPPLLGQGDAFRNRLLLGDAETRKLNKIIEDTFKLLQSTNSEERDVLLLRLKNAIRAVELNVIKTEHVVKMHSVETQNYQEKGKAVASKIEQSREDVITAKQNLREARAHRAQQEEYDALAGVILTLPSRETSLTSIAELKAELQQLQAESDALDHKYEMRKKNFQLLLHTVHDIKQLLKADGELLHDVETVRQEAVADTRHTPTSGGAKGPGDDTSSAKETTPMEVD
eukprot:m.322030 g.322030  ORF g.322030 m.322030 type:complete len:236 (+) comp20345_c0_seq1:205-912(+)